MFSEVNLTLGLIIGFATGILLVIIIARLKSRETEELKISELQNLNYEKRVTPFIKIHESLMDHNAETELSDSVSQLKSKIEGFKLRNQFYQD